MNLPNRTLRHSELEKDKAYEVKSMITGTNRRKITAISVTNFGWLR